MEPDLGRLAELHLHLEGALDVDVLNRIGRQHGLPDLAPDALRIAGWDDSERAFTQILARLRDAAAFREAILCLRARMFREGIAYAEASIMPMIHIGLGVAFDELWRGIDEALSEASDGPCIRILFAIPRNGGAAAGFDTLRLIERARHAAIVGIDLAGTETEGTIVPFIDVFTEARAMGLRTAAHAGEFGPAERVRDTLRLLRPDRIAHGLAAAGDPAVLAELAESGVPVDLSPTGNVAFGAVATLPAHPLRQLYDAGVQITISTDDPALVNTTLPREIALLSELYGLAPGQAGDVAANGFRYAFALPGQA